MLVKIILLGVFCLHSSVVCGYHFEFEDVTREPVNQTENFTRNNVNITPTTGPSTGPKNSSEYLPSRNEETTLGSVNQIANFTRNNVNITSSTQSPWGNQETTTSKYVNASPPSARIITNYTGSTTPRSDAPRWYVGNASTPGNKSHDNSVNSTLSTEIITAKSVKKTTIGLETCEYYGEGEAINITNNGLQRLTKKSFGNSKIKCLNFKNNNINGIEPGFFDEFSSLQYVDLSGNKLNSLFPFGGKEMIISNIETLILDNSLSCQSVYHCGVPRLLIRTKFPNLINLMIRRNNLQRVSFRTKANVDPYCSGNYNYYYKVDDDGNRYCNDFSLTELMPSLSYLDLSHNSIESVEFLDSMPDTLTHLILNNNSIYEFIDISLKNVEELFIDDNNIQNLCPSRYISDNYDRCAERGLKLEDAKKLKKLSLSNTQLEFIHKKAMTNLKNLVKLDLSRNKLSSLDKSVFDYLEKLEILELQSNKLSNLPNFHNLKNLVKLNLSNNYLGNIEDQFNMRNSRLEILSLRNNTINKIQSGAFDSLVHLMELDLSNNRITVLSNDWITRTNNLHILNLNKNKFSSYDDMALENCQNARKLYVLDNNLMGNVSVKSIEKLSSSTLLMLGNSNY